MAPSVRPDPADELACLADPLRRQLYEFVVSQQVPVRRDTAADAAGISRTLAAYHLDRLVESGLLGASYARPEGRSGPGAGRPAKLYQPARDEVVVTVPPRTYEVLAKLLADAVVDDASGQVRTALLAAAEGEGQAAGMDGGDLMETLRGRGYEPAVEGDRITLRNCPFHHLAQRHAELVCCLNEALLRGLLTGRGDDPNGAELAPVPGRCCVTIQRRESTAVQG